MNISTKAEATGIPVNTTYKVNDGQSFDDNIKSIDPNASTGYTITLKTGNVQFTMSSKTNNALVTDKAKNIGYKAFKSQSLLWETINVRNAISEENAKSTANEFFHNLGNGSSKITSVSGSGINNQIKLDNVILTFQ